MSVLLPNRSLKDDLLTNTGSISKDLPVLQKWIAVFFAALTFFGALYIEILPITVETQIENYFNVDDANYNFIFTIGDSPSLFMPLVGGFLLDYFGTRTILFISLTAVLLGQCVMTLGCYLHEYWLLVLGNFIVGFVTDTVQIALFKMTSKLFYDKHLALAVAVCSFFEKAAIISASLLGPFVYNLNNSITEAWMSGVLACAGSLLAGMIAMAIDYKIELREKTLQVVAPPVEVKVSIYDLKHIGLLVWLVGFVNGSAYCAFASFYDNSDAFLQRKFGFGDQAAADLLTVLNVSSLFVTWVTSVYLDKTGKRVYALILGNFSLALALILFQILPNCNQCYTCLLPLGVLGLFVGNVTVNTFGCIPLLVKKEFLGLGFGVVIMIDNIFSTPGPYVFGFLLDYTKENNVYSYTAALYFMVGISCFSLLLAVLVNLLDIKQGRHLHKVEPS